VDSGECTGDVVVTVSNAGSDDASDVVVRIYGGDPSSGGEVLGEASIDGPIAPGDSESVTVDIGSQNRNLTLWGVADPDDSITECNDANNIAPGPSIECDSEPH
jgi:subtilase family serine protease